LGALCPASISWSDPRIRRASFSTRYTISPTVKVLSNPSLVRARQPGGNLQVGDQVPFTTGSATVLDGWQHRRQYHRLQEYRHHSSGAAARQCQRQRRPGHRAGDQQRGPGNHGGVPDADDIAAAREEFDCGGQRPRPCCSPVSSLETENKQRQGIPGARSASGRAWRMRSRIRPPRGRGTELILFIPSDGDQGRGRMRMSSSERNAHENNQPAGGHQPARPDGARPQRPRG